MLKVLNESAEQRDERITNMVVPKLTSSLIKAMDNLGGDVQTTLNVLGSITVSVLASEVRGSRMPKDKALELLRKFNHEMLRTLETGASVQ